MTLSIICVTYGHKKCQVDLFINSLLCQTSPDWKLYMVHDGPNPEVRGWVEAFNDPRINYRESDKRTGYWGHYLRRWIMEEVDTEFLMWNNADNYLTPVFVYEMLDACRKMNLQVCLTDTLHNYPNVNQPGDPAYSVLKVGLGLNRADFTSFIVRTDVAKAVGLNHVEFTGCDGMFLEQLKEWCAKQGTQPRWHEYRSILSVHN